MTNLRLYRYPNEKIPELRQAYENEEWAYCVQQWNDYGLTTEKLCFCPDGVAVVKQHLPTLWE